MKKLLFVLVCAASLVFWMSCNNGAQELDITLHSGVDKKDYSNAGTVTATKVTMVTHQVKKVERDVYGVITNKPADRQDYYIDTVQTLNEGIRSYDEYWFYNDWDAGKDFTFEEAYVNWQNNVDYEKEDVSNAKGYTFGFNQKDNDVQLWAEVIIQKSGDVYQYGYAESNDGSKDYKSIYGTAALEVSGNLEGDFTVGTLLKKLDSRYANYDVWNNWVGQLEGVKYRRLDKRTRYFYDSDYGKYIAEEIPADVSVYYLTNVKFTKN